MGRRYTGDIEGKFWFGVQDSSDALHFGAEEVEPSTVTYYVDKQNEDKIVAGIKKCLEALGEYKNKLDRYFQEHNGYNDRELASYLGVTELKLAELLEQYARYELGVQIRNKVEEQGYCEFQAEL